MIKGKLNYRKNLMIFPLKVIVTFLTNNYHIKTVIQESSSLKEYHDLDYLVGTWTEEDEAEFLQNTNHFNQVDAKLW